MTDIPSGYTPGPWKVYHAKLRPQFSTVVIEVQPRAGGQPIVAWPGFDNGHVTKKRHLANARLIALAPEMADEIVRLRADLAQVREELNLNRLGLSLTRDQRDDLRALNAELLEGLKLADASLSGAHMNMKVVQRAVQSAIAKAEGRT